MNRRQFISSVVASGAAPMLFNGCVGGFFANLIVGFFNRAI